MCSLKNEKLLMRNLHEVLGEYNSTASQRFGPAEEPARIKGVEFVIVRDERNEGRNRRGRSVLRE